MTSSYNPEVCILTSLLNITHATIHHPTIHEDEDKDPGSRLISQVNLLTYQETVSVKTIIQILIKNVLWIPLDYSPRITLEEGNGCTVQTWFAVFTDGTDETREYEEELNDTSAPATDILSEVTGRERNKEEILDAVRPYKSQDDDKFIIQDGRRPGGLQ